MHMIGARGIKWLVFAVIVVSGLTSFLWSRDLVKVYMAPIGTYKNKNSPPTVLCLILTTAKSIEKQKAVNSTWIKRCDKALFLLGKGVAQNHSQLIKPDMLGIDAVESRRHLPGKVKKAFKYAYENHIDAFDWILKCDDDTYVLMDNLKHFLSKLKPTEPSYIGFRLKGIFMSGGAGYLISSSGLRKTVEVGYQTNACNFSVGQEDVLMGNCFKESGLRIIQSWDEEGRETFHPEGVRKYVYPPYAGWLNSYAYKKPIFGPGCCSRNTITFHRLSPADMFVYELLLYNIDTGERRIDHDK